MNDEYYKNIPTIDYYSLKIFAFIDNEMKVIASKIKEIQMYDVLTKQFTSKSIDILDEIIQLEIITPNVVALMGKETNNLVMFNVRTFEPI